MAGGIPAADPLLRTQTATRSQKGDTEVTAVIGVAATLQNRRRIGRTDRRIEMRSERRSTREAVAQTLEIDERQWNWNNIGIYDGAR